MAGPLLEAKAARVRFRVLFLSVLWPLALRGFPNVLNVGKIAQPARRELRCNQIVLGNKEPVSIETCGERPRAGQCRQAAETD